MYVFTKLFHAGVTYSCFHLVLCLLINDKKCSTFAIPTSDQLNNLCEVDRFRDNDSELIKSSSLLIKHEHCPSP